MADKLLIFGSRPQKLWGFRSDIEYHELARNLEEVLRDIANPQTHFIIPAGQGAVTCALHAIRTLSEKTYPDWEYDMYLPYPSFYEKWPRGGIFGQDDLEDALDHASNIYIIDPEPADTTRMQQALRHRNEMVCAKADHVLLISPTYPDNASGGTGAIYRQAKKHGLPITWCDTEGFVTTL